jgi:hypothetical protein
MVFPKPSSVKKQPKRLRSMSKKETHAHDEGNTEQVAFSRVGLIFQIPAARWCIPTTVSGEVRAMPKTPQPVRDRDYRMLVASLECFECGIHHQSQAAHPNSGKAKGKKLDDLLCFPMCSVGGRDCHGKFDRYEIVPKGAEMMAYERRAHIWTVKTLISRGLWPMRLPIPDVRSFDC